MEYEVIHKYKKTSTKHTGRNKKLTPEIINDLFNSKGVRVVAKDLLDVTVKDKIPFICNTHSDEGVQYRSYENMKKAQCCCEYGKRDYIANKQSKSSIEDVIVLCKEKGYILLTDSIRSVDDDIEYICELHKDYGIQKTSLWGLQRTTHSCKMCRQALHSGENHWNWQGGVGLERDMVKQTYQYKQWRIAVFERDNYTCQCCGERGGKLNAHHIENYADNPDLRLDVDNGITLCKKCHAVGIDGSFHNIYGTYNNTKGQLEEYIRFKRILIAS